MRSGARAKGWVMRETEERERDYVNDDQVVGIPGATH